MTDKPRNVKKLIGAVTLTAGFAAVTLVPSLLPAQDDFPLRLNQGTHDTDKSDRDPPVPSS